MKKSVLKRIFLGNVYPSVGYDDEIIRVYLAKGLAFKEQHLDEGEFLSLKRMPLAQLVEEVMAGRVPDSKTQIAALKTARLLAGET